MSDDADLGSSASIVTFTESGIGIEPTDAPGERWERPTSSDGQTFTGFTSLTISTVLLGSVLVGYLSGNDVVPLLIISGAGLLITSAWYARTKLFRLSLFFGSFGGFIYTYVLVQLGITNRWYGIPIQHLTHLVSTYFSIWFVVFLIVAVAMRFMSMLLTSVLLVTDLGVACILLANVRGSLDLLTVASVPFFMVPLLCIYYLSTTTLKDRRKGTRAGSPRRKFSRSAGAIFGSSSEEGRLAGAAPTEFRSAAQIEDGSRTRVAPMRWTQRTFAPVDGLQWGRRCTRIGIVFLVVAGVVLVPVSMVPAFARGVSVALADLRVTSSRSALSAFEGNLPVGLPSEASVAVEGLPALPHVIQADPVALDLIGYGPVQLTAPALQAITGGLSSIGTIADPTTISSSSINPVIRALFAKRRGLGSSGARGKASSGTAPGAEPESIPGRTATAYIVTSTAPTNGMAMVCPAGRHVVTGGGSIDTPGAVLVATSATDVSGAASATAQTARGWSITYSKAGTVTLWVICRS
jgi:hypothetical protein